MPHFIRVPTVCLDKHQPQSPEYNIILETITSDPSIYTMDRPNIYGRLRLKISLTIVLTCPRGLSFKTVSALCSSFDHSSSLLGSPCQSPFSARTIMAFQQGAEPEPQYRNMFLFDIFYVRVLSSQFCSILYHLPFACWDLMILSSAGVFFEKIFLEHHQRVEQFKFRS